MKIKIKRPHIRENLGQTYSPAARLAIVSLVLCGLVFPLVVTGFAQVLLPNQANGSIVQLHNRDAGSDLISQSFTKPFFFRPRNDSASGVDPDITIDDAYSQIPRINSATGISSSDLRTIVDQNLEGQWWIFGQPYVNVLRLNRTLIEKYPAVYSVS